MTRIFDALRKAQGSRPAPAEPESPVVPVPPAAAHPAGPRPARPAPTRAEHLVNPRPLMLPPGVTSALPEDVLREMTMLRVSLESVLPDRAPRVIMLESSQAGEGTSTVVMQLALALAQDTRIRTLLVDLNARRPAHPAPAAPAGAPGFAEGTMVAHLDVLPLAELFHSSGHISASDARQAVESSGAGYDWVLLDGPPVLESPDAATLAAVADGVVVVVQAHRTKRPVLARAVELLRSAGGRVLGSVLNRRRLEIPEFIYRRI
jgi:Mrp family chromosome partitioning ATPase